VAGDPARQVSSSWQNGIPFQPRWAAMPAPRLRSVPDAKIAARVSLNKLGTAMAAPFCSSRFVDLLYAGSRPLRQLAQGAALLALAAAASANVTAAERPADRMLRQYFHEETARLHARTAGDFQMLDDWTAKRAGYREQLFEMVGLSPRPDKSDLKATITGREERDEFYVEKLHYQSMPGLYATANLYVPKNRKGKVPAILYVCGHGNVKEGGISYGAKAVYQHHGAWFARHGYVCLTIDTIQLGELEGLHHGTYREGMWWWNSRGYTPGGVEAWNSIRALDYLQSRPEVDAEKIGMTGRSGGGAYTWLTAALDERVKVAVPVAGMTDLQNYVVDGCVTGHCDCMFLVNTYRWDYAKMAALIAPRPLLISNTDKDGIFPLDGVQRVHRAVASVYAFYKASDKLGLLITEGPHKDTQDLQVPAFRWFNRFLKGEEPLIRTPAEKLFTPKELKVFATLPVDQRTTKIHETFVAMAAPNVPAGPADWQRQRTDWMQALREKTFAGWPGAAEPVNARQISEQNQGELRETHWEFTSQGAVRLPLYVLSKGERVSGKPVHVHVADEQSWNALAGTLGTNAVSSPGTNALSPKISEPLDALRQRAARGEIALAILPPRGIGPTASSGDAKDQVQIRRRYMLLGQTLDGMRVWDIQRAVQTLRQPALFGNAPIHLHGERHQGINALYATLFTDGIASLEVIAPPTSHATGPDYLNVLRFLDIPQAAAMAAERQPVRFRNAASDAWTWTKNTARALNWPADRLQWW
jgi:dienelactone hydrolase